MSDWKENCPWYERAVFYHIYPLGMCGVPKHHADFVPGNVPEQHFKEMEQLLAHVKRLGVTALYIGPLFESEGHGYETTDYYKVDSRLGDNNSFKHFVEACHKQDIRVVVDGVFNHSGRSFFAFQDLKQKREGSAYRDWYCNVNFWGNNEFNDGFSYEAWHGYNILPRLNLWNSAVRGYLLDVVRFWRDEFDIDGIRLDCADVLHFDFMKELRALANQVKPDFWLMGEVIHGDYSRWVNRDMLHSVTNYELHKGLYSGHNDHNYFEIAHTVRRLFDRGGLVREGKLYTFVENHDVNRLIDKVNKVEHMENIYLLSYTLPGIPSIYYGGEFRLHGVQANGSDDAIRPAISLAQYQELAEKEKVFVDYLAMLGQAKELLPALSVGRYEERMLTNRQYAFARISEGQTVLVAVNNDESAVKMNIRAEAGEYIDFETNSRLVCENGTLSLELPPHSGKLLVKGGFERRNTEKETVLEAGKSLSPKASEKDGAASTKENSAQNTETDKNNAAETKNNSEENPGMLNGNRVPADCQLSETEKITAPNWEITSNKLADGARFEGILLKEGIDNEEILDGLAIHKVELWKTEDKPRYRTALHFSTDHASFPEDVAKVMVADSARGGNWFADFHYDNIRYLVFRNRILCYEIGNEVQKQEVMAKCRELGIQEDQLN